MKQVQGEEKVLRIKELIGPAEEVGFMWTCSAFKRRRGRRHLPRLEERLADPGDLQKNVLAQDGKITLEHILVVWVPPVALLVRIVVAERMALPVAIPFRKTDAPAILDRNKMIIFLRIA